MTFREAVEKRLAELYIEDEDMWNELFDWYEERYLNPNSPEGRRKKTQ